MLCKSLTPPLRHILALPFTWNPLRGKRLREGSKKPRRPLLALCCPENSKEKLALPSRSGGKRKSHGPFFASVACVLFQGRFNRDCLKVGSRSTRFPRIGTPTTRTIRARRRRDDPSGNGAGRWRCL